MLFKSTSLAFVVLLLGVAAAAIQKVNKPNLSKQRDVTNPAIIAAKPKAISSDYLITMDRTVTMSQKDKILDILMQKDGVVREIYDYRVFKGILFSAASDAASSLTAWKSALDTLDGVKSVEADSVVKSN